MTTKPGIVSTSAVASPTVDSSAGFIRDAHELLRDLAAPNARHYWIDLLTTIAVLDLAWIVYVRAPQFSIVQGVSLVICGLGMYRAAVFTHEIAHQRRSTLKGFATA